MPGVLGNRDRGFLTCQELYCVRPRPENGCEFIAQGFVPAKCLGRTRGLQGEREELGARNRVVARRLRGQEAEGLVELLCGDELWQNVQAHA